MNEVKALVKPEEANKKNEEREHIHTSKNIKLNC